jgi:hypothetical protein
MLGGTKQGLTWNAEVSVSELQAYLEGAPNDAIEGAPWRLDDHHVAQETYLNLDLSKVLKANAREASLLARHPDGRWMPAKKLVSLILQDGADEEDASKVEAEPAMLASSGDSITEQVSEPIAQEPAQTIGDPPK